MSDIFTTDCLQCDDVRRDRAVGVEALVARMILCPTCGNKRCPKAAFHGNECSESNAPGQVGA